MRALVNDTAQQRLVPVELADPVPGARELLVEVRAAGLNRADLAARAGTRRMAVPSDPTAPPQVAGLELAGEVVAVGSEVASWRVGDRVMSRGCGYADLAVVPQAFAMRVPPSLTWEEAGALPVALLTVHDALTNARMEPGAVVLVHAATSGVGVAAVKMAAELGASAVLATSRSAAKLAVLAAHLGERACPVVGIDTTEEDLVSAVGQHTDGRGVDVVLDSIGAPVLATNMAVAAIGGCIVQVGRLGGRSAEIDLDEVARKRLHLVGVTFRTRTQAEIAEVVHRCVEAVSGSLDRHRPRIERSFPLHQAAQAQDVLAQDRHVGKLVLVP